MNASEQTPRAAALVAMATLPRSAPVARVLYASTGRTLVIGGATAAIAWAERLAADLDVSVLVTDDDGERREAGTFAIRSGRVESIAGHLGAFDVTWTPTTMSGARGATRAEIATRERFDLVFDLSAESCLSLPRNPPGYFAPGDDDRARALAARELAQLVGEFEKPKYFAYDERLCAHGRSGKIGCTQCIDVCSTAAIRSGGDGVEIDPHRCMGCGGCATVCPTGAMTYAYPAVDDLGARLKRVLSVYRAAGGRDATLLFHDGEAGRKRVRDVERKGRGLPEPIVPIEVQHTASIGLDVMLGAIALGASRVVVVSTETDADAYAEALDRQMAHGQTILHALGYAGQHFVRLAPDSFRTLEDRLHALPSTNAPAAPATFNLGRDKRTTLEFAIEHLARHAPAAVDSIPLEAGAPWGAIRVSDACTLCKACVGACPSSALVDVQDAPVLRFIERNCVQCGLCVRTCPEDAITLVPRLDLTRRAREPIVLAEAQPFECVRCRKPFGTRQMIERMTSRLGTHAMFAGGPALRRLQMCADCRVIDLMEARNEVTIFDVKRD